MVQRFPSTLGIAAGVLLVLATGASGAPLGVGKLGVGAFGISDIPVAQDDAGAGTVFGLRGRLGVLPKIQVEPSITFWNSGDGASEGGIALEAPSVTSYSLNALLRSGAIGFSWYLTGGIGWSSVDVPGGLGSSNDPTYNFGLGAEFGLGPLSGDISSRLFLVNTSSGASRKHLGILAGVTYYFN